MPGCTWAYTAGQRVVHILKGNVTLCRRRLRNPVTVRAVQPDVLSSTAATTAFAASGCSTP